MNDDIEALMETIASNIVDDLEKSLATLHSTNFDKLQNIENIMRLWDQSVEAANSIEKALEHKGIGEMHDIINQVRDEYARNGYLPAVKLCRELMECSLAEAGHYVQGYLRD